MMDEDALDAAYAQQDNEERRQWEDRLLARAQRVYEEFDRDLREWLKEHA